MFWNYIYSCTTNNIRYGVINYIGDIMIMYINKKDLINSINNCEHLEKDKIKSDEKSDDA